MKHISRSSKNGTGLYPNRLFELAERIELTIRPLSARSHSPDHNSVRELYVEMRSQCSSNALERARRAVLSDILYTVVHAGKVEG